MPESTYERIRTKDDAEQNCKSGGLNTGPTDKNRSTSCAGSQESSHKTKGNCTGAFRLLRIIEMTWKAK
jgi:hypothetical protein